MQEILNGFLDEIFMLSNIEAAATLWEVMFAVGISFLLTLMISYVYTKTHQSTFYTQSFVHTLIIMGVVISVIIVVIGSNIARAFSLAGALSIIRFRSAIRDPKDVAFIFFVMGTGLACGTGLYVPAAFFAVIMCILILMLHYLNYGKKTQVQKTLKITIPENLNYEGHFDDLFKEHLLEANLVGVRTTNLGTMFELTYLIRTKPGLVDKKLMDQIRMRNANLGVAILMGQSYIEG